MFSCFAPRSFLLEAADLEFRFRIEALIGLVNDAFAIARVLVFLSSRLFRKTAVRVSHVRSWARPQSFGRSRDLKNLHLLFMRRFPPHTRRCFFSDYKKKGNRTTGKTYRERAHETLNDPARGLSPLAGTHSMRTGDRRRHYRGDATQTVAVFLSLAAESRPELRSRRAGWRCTRRI